MFFLFLLILVVAETRRRVFHLECFLVLNNNNNNSNNNNFILHLQSTTAEMTLNVQCNRKWVSWLPKITNSNNTYQKKLGCLINERPLQLFNGT